MGRGGSHPDLAQRPASSTAGPVEVAGAGSRGDGDRGTGYGSTWEGSQVRGGSVWRQPGKPKICYH